MAEADYRLMTEATGQRIAAALEALHLATVTGVKGDTEQNYRHGDVNLTPANIGAVATSAVIDIPHGGTGATDAALYIEYDYTSVLDVIDAVKDTRIFPISIQKSNSSASYSDMPAGYETVEWNMELVGNSTRLTAFLFLYGNAGVYKRDFFNGTGVGTWITGWVKVSPITPAGIGAVSTSDVINVDHGGTGATQGTIDITDYCVFPTGNANTSSTFGGRLYYNPYLNCVFGTIAMNDGASVTNQGNIVYLRKDSSGTPLIANRTSACGVCVHSAVSPIVVPRIDGSTIISSHTTGDPIDNPRYTIMAFLG